MSDVESEEVEPDPENVPTPTASQEIFAHYTSVLNPLLDVTPDVSTNDESLIDPALLGLAAGATINVDPWSDI